MTIQSKEHDVKQSIRAELTQLRHKLEEEQKELDKLKIMREVLTKDVEKLHNKKRSLLTEIETLSITPKIDVMTTPKIDTKSTATKTTPTSKPDSFSSSPDSISSALLITGPALVLSNPVVGSTHSDESTLIASSGHDTENKQTLVGEPQVEEDREQLLDLCPSDDSLSPSPPPSHKPHSSSLSYKAHPSPPSHNTHSPPPSHNTHHVRKSTQSKKRVRMDNESSTKKPHTINKDKLLESLQSKLDKVSSIIST